MGGVKGAPSCDCEFSNYLPLRILTPSESPFHVSYNDIDSKQCRNVTLKRARRAPYRQQPHAGMVSLGQGKPGHRSGVSETSRLEDTVCGVRVCVSPPAG